MKKPPPSDRSISLDALQGVLADLADPNATHGIVIGAIPPPQALGRLTEILWLSHSADGDPKPRGIAPEAINRIETDLCAPGDVAAALERFINARPKRMPGLILSQESIARRAASYERTLEEVHAQLESHTRARSTREAVGFQWQRNVLANLGNYVSRRVPSAWADSLQGTPAIVCGAGPSLDASMERLSAAAPSAIVIAGDSSLRALCQAGDKADIAVSVDSAKTPDRCRPLRDPSLLVLSPQSPTSWLDGAHTDRSYFLSNNSLTVDWLASQGLARTEIGVTENCGSTGIGLARFLGCSPIYLFGIDYSADPSDPGRRHHTGADPALYSNSGYQRGQRFPEVMGNYAEKVPTYMYGDWRALDRRLASWAPGLVVNVNDRGARFSNTRLVHPNQFRFAHGALDKASLLNRLAAPQQDDPSVLEGTFQQVREIGQALLTALPALRSVLATKGPRALVTELQALFRDPVVGLIFGAYSLKMLPQLLAPIVEDEGHWRTLLEELSELSALAARASP